MPPKKKVRIADSVTAGVSDNLTSDTFNGNTDNVENDTLNGNTDKINTGIEQNTNGSQTLQTDSGIDHVNLPQDNLYMETIDRNNLDFDFEKICCVSLASTNIYACLVCGKYLQGRGKSSQAYFHSIDAEHHVYINLENLNVYVLPDGYEVKSSSLDDIKYVVNPTYTKQAVKKLDLESITSHDLTYKVYYPGLVGLNNIKSNDYANVIIQTLAHIPALRNYFLLENLVETPPLASLFGLLVRKLWNPRAFRSHVSPHELLQYISTASSKKFTLDNQGDPFEFLNWLVNHLHTALGGTRQPGSSIIHRVLQGKMLVLSQTVIEKKGSSLRFEAESEVDMKTSPFMFLSLDLPPAPLFRDDFDLNAIPQVPLLTLLNKYDGSTAQELPGKIVRYQLLQLPRYLILHIKRGLSQDRNRAVVSFNPALLDLASLVKEDVEMNGKDVKTTYSLLANITHEHDTTDATAKHYWKVQLKNLATGEWNEMQDLEVKKLREELLILEESVIQVWERCK